MFKAKVWTPIIVVFLITAILIGYFYFGFDKKPIILPPDNFSKLIINTAYAQDNFEVEAAAIDSTGIDSGTTFMIKSKDAIASRDALADNVSFSPTVDYDLTQIDEHNFKIIPKTPLESRQVYRLAINSKYIDDEGNEQKRDYSWAFQVKDQFKILGTLPRNEGNYVPTDTGIEITFSHENFINYEDKVSIEPQTEGRFEKHKRTLVFIPKKLNPGQIYTVTVKSGIGVSESDVTLAEDYVFSFETSPTNEQRGDVYNSSFGFSADFNEFPDTMTPAFVMQAYNLNKSEFPVKIYAFKSVDNFIEALQSSDHIPYWASYSRGAHRFDHSGLDEVASYNLPLTDYENSKYLILPEALSKGFYLIEAEYNGRFSQAFIQISNISTYSTITKTDTLVWVNSLETKGPVSGASIKVVDSNVEAFTDQDGIATFNTQQAFGDNENTRKNKYLKAESQGSLVVIPIWFYNSYYDYSYNTAYWQHFYTDRTMYQPDDVINFWAFIKNRDNSPINGKLKVRLFGSQYYNYYNEPIAVVETDLELDSNGVGLGNLRLDNLTPGGYNLQLMIGDKVVSSNYISVQTYTKPAYKIEVTPKKKAIFAGEDIVVDVKTNFFEGTPVADLDLVEPNRKINITTDDQGQAQFSFATTYSDCQEASYYCYYPQTSQIALSPVKAEEGQIDAYSYVQVFGPHVDSEVKFVKEKDSNQASITTSVYNIDLDKINNGDSFDAKGGPAGNKNITAEIFEVVYEKKEVGEYYDFINKIVHKKYEYNRKETSFVKYSGTTNQNGEHTHSLTIDPQKTYYVRVMVDDGQGRHDLQVRYLYSRYSGSGDYAWYRLSLKNPEDNEFAIGDLVEFEFLNNEELLPKAEKENFLYYHLQNGLIERETSNQPEHSFNFKEQYIPNIYVKGVWFDGVSYKTSQYSSFRDSGGGLVSFDEESRRLNIDVSTDKKDYLPGEEASISVKVTDQTGRPVRASVNLNLVDEAYYQLRNESVDPLDNIYNAYMPSGEISFYSSHRAADMVAESGAEGGGCFLAGTKVKLADGSEKNIEDIVVGDKILTFSDDKNHNLVAADVVSTTSHVVDGYLIINGHLKVTPEHRIFVNGGWQMIGEAKVGDYLLAENGQQVLIDSIEWRREPVKVYNFQTEPYHTYIANGIYVHNQKGGTREEFVDNALFTSVVTNDSGQASTKLTLPDNITSWRITAQAITKDVFAGDNTANINVSLPVFVEGSFAKEYLLSDKPTIKLRAYGTALKSGDDVNFSLSADTLNFSQEDIKGKAFQENYVDLPELSLGEHKINYSVDFSSYDDTVIKPIEVVQSRLRQSLQNFYKLENGLKPVGSDQYRTNLTFSDHNQGMMYRQLKSLSWSYGDRVDQELSRSLAKQLLKDYFDEDTYYQGDFNSGLYQLSDGGIALLPYSSSELELSARLTYLAASEFDEVNLANYFYNTYNSKNSNQEEVALALFGLASLHEPVLIPLQNFAQLDNLTAKERLYIALGLQKIGDTEMARKIYLALMNEFGENMGDKYTRLKVGEDQDDYLIHTSLIAILAGAINDPYHESLWQYVEDNYSKEVLLNLEKLSYVSAVLPNLNPGGVKFKLKVAGQEIEQTLEKGMTYKISVSPEELKNIEFYDIEGNVGLVSSYEVPLVSLPTESSPYLDIYKEYYVAGQKTNTFKENDLVEVRIYPGISNQALEGYYQVTDLMPSGMAALTSVYSPYVYNNYGCSFRYPYNIDGQRIKFNVSRGWNDKCDNYFRYYARVVNPGQYTVEPIQIQNYKDTSIYDYSDGSQVTISR
ncbi:hypothetical protein C4566_00995 [Candidatus Parcubacteria bacterium]|nr:MAG: hypothetical protein C4566_00995 [Candidatus Parcubacteria bacterium]